MRLQGRVFVIIGVFLLVIGSIYWVFSREAAGTVLLLASSILSLFAGAFLLFEEHRYGPGVEDRQDADTAEGEGEVGVFPTATAWPLIVGIGTVATFHGLIIGPWVFVLGAAVLVVGIAGYVFSVVWSPAA